jgi:3D (Asp-Asp-Asp) domain-containing protein
MRGRRPAALALALALAVGVLGGGSVGGVAAAEPACREMRITGYVRSEGGARTYDGTSIYADEAIVAASWDIPLGSTVEVEGLGTFRVADRGMLGSSGWIDIAVWSRAEAYRLTGRRTVCVLPPGEAS